MIPICSIIGSVWAHFELETPQVGNLILIRSIIGSVWAHFELETPQVGNLIPIRSIIGSVWAHFELETLFQVRNFQGKAFVLCSLLIYLCKICVGTSVKSHVRSNAGLNHGNLLESKGHVSTFSA